MRFKLISMAACALSVSVAANAQGYPNKPITLVVPFAAGGTVNLMARLIAQHMSDELKQPVVVDNRAGAGGSIGAAFVAKAPADGYTLLLSSMGQVVQPLLYKKLPFDGTKAFTSVATFAAVPNVLAVSNKLPVKTLPEFVSYAKANPGRLNMGSAGVGSINHLLGEMFSAGANVKLTHVPYKGASPAVTDLQAGQIDVLFANLPNVLPFAKAGKLRLLGVASSKRTAELPNVPTFAEGGVKGVVLESWYGVMTPTGTPEPIVKTLQDVVLKATRDQSFTKQLAEQGAVPYPNNSVAAGKLFDSEYKHWSDILSNTQIQMD